MKTRQKQTNDIRQNPATGQWVIYALSRRKRPREVVRPEKPTGMPPAYDPGCPFCPGNESALPGILFELKEQGALWQARAVMNKYPALTRKGDLQRVKQGMYLSVHGYGSHEVVVETPSHNRQIPFMTISEVERIIEVYHRRYIDLLKAERNMLIVIFRNYGSRAGASLFHPHSQIISTGIVPGHIRNAERVAQSYFDDWGHCVYCDILSEELASGSRMVAENPSFACFVPYAAEQPFEMWFMPKQHKADFGSITEHEKADLASILHTMLKRLHHRLEGPDYNYVIQSWARHREGEPQMHWYLALRPRFTTRAGFEIGSGMSINTDLPEEDAAFLRADENP